MLRFVLLTLVAVATTSPTAASADPPFPRISPVLRFQCNTYEALQLKKQLQATWGDNVDIPETVSSLLEMGGAQVPKRDGQVAVQVNFTQSKKGYIQEIVVPATATVLKELLDNESTTSLTVGDYVGIIHAAITGSDDNQMSAEDAFAAYGENLRKTLHNVDADPIPDVLRYESYPSQLKATYARTKIQGLMASAATLAQRRDGEDESIHRVRSVGAQFLIESGQICLEHLEQFTVAMQRVESDRSAEVSLSLKTNRKSPLAAAFDDVGQVRNRSLSYLHPDYQDFAAIALPIPDLLADPAVLAGILRMTPLAQEFGESPVLDAVFERLSESACQSNMIEVLVQSIPCSDGSTSLAIVCPLRDGQAGSLERSGIQQVGFSPSPNDVERGTCYRLTPSLVDIDTPHYSLDIAETEECIAFLIGTDAANSTFRTIIQRDFDESPAARRYGTSAIAADVSLSAEWASRILRISNDWKGCKSKQPLKTRLTVFTDVDQGKLEVIARFEEDAALMGALYVDLVWASAMESGFEWLVE